MELLKKYGPLVGVLSFGLGIIGILLTWLIFAWGRPDIRLEILSRTRMTEVNDVSGLIISYNKIPLTDQNADLSVVALRFRNAGWGDLLPMHYMEGARLGFSIESEPKSVQLLRLRDDGPRQAQPTTSLPYIPETPQIQEGIASGISRFIATTIEHDPENAQARVGLGQPIMEAGQSLVIKVLVIHAKETELEVRPTGGISGMNNQTFDVASDRLIKPWFGNGEIDFWIALGLAVVMGGTVSTLLTSLLARADRRLAKEDITQSIIEGVWKARRTTDRLRAIRRLADENSCAEVICPDCLGDGKGTPTAEGSCDLCLGDGYVWSDSSGPSEGFITGDAMLARFGDRKPQS